MATSGVFLVSEVSVSSTLDFDSIVSRGRFYHTRETDIRNRLTQKIQKENNVSHTYKDLIRAMLAVFNDVGYIDGQNGWKPVTVAYGNPERAIAKLKQENNIILPIITIAQTTTNNDTARNRYDSVLVNESYWDKNKHKAIRVISFAPKAVTIMYSINIWAKYNEDMDQILEQIRLKFNPEISLPTKVSTLTKGSIDSEEDIGNNDAPDKEDRTLKRMLTVSVRTYIPNPKYLVTSTGALERLNIEAEVY